MRKSLIIIGLLIAFAILAACATPAATTPQVVRETVVIAGTPQVVEKIVTATPPPATKPAVAVAQAVPYRIGVFSDIKTTNYWSYQGPNNSVWQRYIMAPQRLGLYNINDKRFDLVPEVATNLDAPRVKDGDKWTITTKIKSGIKWSDGKELTAKDFAFTANTAIELELTGPMASTYDREYLEKVEAVDNATIKYIWKKAPGLAKWEWGAAQGAVMSEAYWAPIVADAKKALAGVDKNNKDAFAKALNDARAILLNHSPQGEPLVGSFTFVKWEKGAYAENKAYSDSWFKDVQKTVYKNGGYTESKGSFA